MTTAGVEVWRPTDGYDLEISANSIRRESGKNVYRPDILDVIETSIDSLSNELRALSLDIHGERSLFCFI
jgi:hypothetical protein